MLKYFQNKFKFIDNHTKEVIRRSATSLVVRIVGVVAGLFVSIVLGRTLGSEGIGLIRLSQNIVGLLLIISLFGMRNVLIKEIAIGYAKKDMQYIGNLMKTAYFLNGLITIFISVVLILITPWISLNVFNEPRLTIILVIAIIAMIPKVYSQIFSSGLIGYNKIWQSSLADNTLTSVIAGIILFFLWLLKLEITIVRVAVSYAVGNLLVMLSLGLYWKKLFLYKKRKKIIVRTVLKTAIPFFILSSSNTIIGNAAVIILGWFENSKQVGLYSVALGLSVLSSFFLQITNTVIAPKLASMFANKKMKEMEKMVHQISKGLAVIALIPLLIFIVGGKYLLSIWGAEFIDAYWILIILSIGQFFNVLTGCVGVLLNMCGLEKLQVRITGVFLIVNLVLNFLLINYWGIIGAAISTSVIVISSNIVKSVLVKKKIGIKIISFK